MPNHFCRNRSGSVAVPFAILAVVVTVVVGCAINLVSLNSQKSALKTLADNAALSAVREMTVATDDPLRIKSIAKAYVEFSPMGAAVDVSPEVDLKARTVTVSLAAERRQFFPNPASSGGKLKVSSTAKLAGNGGNVCMVGLSPNAISTLRMESMARISAESCAIYSNSTSMSSMNVASSAKVSAELICVSGGYQGKKPDKSQRVVEDCPPLEDPLASRPVPKVGSCDYKNTRITGKARLRPGVYCGGLAVDGGTAELKPGIYIITGGRFLVTNGGTLQGDDVGFYLADDASKIGFDYKANIDIAAPRDGVLAGMLIMSAPYADALELGRLNKLRTVQTVNTTLRTTDGILPPDHVIRSDNARRLVGTIYLPNGKLLIDGRSTIADRSEYTVIIADTFELREGPDLVLRTDYGMTEVPVPEGVGPTGGGASVLIN